MAAVVVGMVCSAGGSGGGPAAYSNGGPWVVYVDTWALTSWSDGSFSQYLPDDIGVEQMSAIRMASTLPAPAAAAWGWASSLPSFLPIDVARDCRRSSSNRPLC